MVVQIGTQDWGEQCRARRAWDWREVKGWGGGGGRRWGQGGGGICYRLAKQLGAVAVRCNAVGVGSLGKG